MEAKLQTSSQGADNARGIKKGKSCEQNKKPKQTWRGKEKPCTSSLNRQQTNGGGSLKREGETLHRKPQQTTNKWGWISVQRQSIQKKGRKS